MKNSIHHLLLIRLPVFLIPAAVVLALPAAVLFLGGEWTGSDEAARIQQSSRVSVLVGPVYTNPARRFKLESVKRAHPDVLILGSSHLTQIRASFFKPGTAYSGTVGGMRLPDPYEFVHRLPAEHQPKLILVGIDPFFSNVDPWAKRDSYDETLSGLDSAVRTILTSWREVYADIFAGKIDLKRLWQRGRGGRFIGLNAVLRGSGYRPDGSHQNSDEPSNRSGRWLSGPAPDFGNLAGGRTFAGSSSPPEIKQFLEECDERNIDVIGFFPPVTTRVMRSLDVMKETRGYLPNTARMLGKVFGVHGFRFYDYSDAAAFGARDEEAYNDFHFGEKAYGRLIRDMADRDPGLIKFIEPTPDRSEQ